MLSAPALPTPVAAFALAALCTVSSGGILAATDEASLKFFQDLAETRNFTLGRPVAPKLTPDGQTVIYLRGGPRDPVMRLYEFRLPGGPERELLAPEQLLGGAAETLTQEEKARRERARITIKGFTRFDLSKDGERLLVTLAGQLHVINRGGATVTTLPGRNWIDPRFSPDASAVAAVADGELHVIELGTTPIISRQLTTGATATLSHGRAEFVAQEEMDRSEGFWWTPDSQSIVYQETDESRVPVRFIADPLDPGASPATFFYPVAGSTNASVRLGIIPRTGGLTHWIKWDTATFPYLTRVVWREPGDPLCLSVMDRAQQVSLLLRADPTTGDTAELLREADSAWVNLDDRAVLPRWLPGGRGFLWTTESRGSWQVELRATDGTLVHPITPPNFIYKGLVKLDAPNGLLVVNGGFDPRESHLWRFPLGGGEGTLLTTRSGHHSAFFSENAATFVHSFDLLDGTAGAEVLTSAGAHVATLPSLAEPMPARPNLELVRVGENSHFHAALVRPRAFERGKKYPVILSVYAGPGVTVVHATARAYLSDQWLADQGYVVVRIDGRGTPFRGRDWERTIRGNLIDTALDDQIAGLHDLGQRYHELDLERVGVTGWSFGGYFSAMATIRRPDVFACGVAGAPVTTWENYDTFYTERYLGLPQSNAHAYRSSSVLTYASQLSRPLLLIHGLTDDNVYAQHTLQLADSLFMAGRPFEFMPLLGTHLAGSSDPAVKLRLQQRVVEFFNRILKPAH
jgi:dipeptidyl-peptidase-4